MRLQETRETTIIRDKSEERTLTLVYMYAFNFQTNFLSKSAYRIDQECNRIEWITYTTRIVDRVHKKSQIDRCKIHKSVFKRP